MNVASTACELCRRCHRKCDRMKPACTYCAERNKDCLYREPVDRATKPSNKFTFRDMTKKFVANCTPSVKEDELARINHSSTHVDICLENLFYYIPVIGQQRARDIMLYIRNVMTIGESVEMNLFKPQESEIALLFAIQAMSFVRSDHKEIAAKLYDKSRQTLLPIFDFADENFGVAACFGCLTQYLINDGDITRANFFLNNSKRYFDHLKRLPNEQEQVLLHLISFNHQILKFSDNMIENFKNMLPTHVAHLIDDADIDMIDQIAYDHIFCSLEERVSKNDMPMITASSRKIYLFALVQGAKIQKLRTLNIPINDLHLQIANSITELVSCNYFTICNCWISTALKEAATIHLNYLEIEPSIDVIDKLNKDLKGLRIMSDRYAMIRTLYGNFIRELEDRTSLSERIFSTVGDLAILPRASIKK